MAARVRWRLAAAAVAVTAVGVVAGVLVLRSARPNVLLITIDTLRADRLSCYGYAGGRTPSIDRLAAEGLRFRNAFCDVTWTTPSMSSVMTGSYATRHGLRSTYQQLDPANTTLAEVLKAHGYRTAAIIGSYPLDHVFGLDQGFDSYDDRFSAPAVVGGKAAADRLPSRFCPDIDEQRLFQYLKAQADAYRPDNEVSDAAIAWLAENRHEPFFLWVHYFGPHELSDMRLGWKEQDEHTIAVYDADVRRTDAEVGRLLAALDEHGLRGRTLTILHADHGQSLGEHLYVGHGRNLYDPTLRVPLVIRLPGVVPSGATPAALARNVDIMPTVLDLLRLPRPQPIDGDSLRPLWQQPDPPDRELYCETYLPATEAFQDVVPDGQGGTMKVAFRRRGIRTARWKLVLNEPWPLIDFAHPPAVPDEIVRRFTSAELYDVVANPLEMSTGVVVDRPDVVTALRERIAAHAAVAGHASGRRDLDEAGRQRLRSLGYVQ